MEAARRKDIPGRKLQVDVSFRWRYQKKVIIFTMIDGASRIAYSSILEDHNEQDMLVFISELISKVLFPIRTSVRTKDENTLGKYKSFWK